MRNEEMKVVSPSEARANYVAEHRELSRKVRELLGQAETANSQLPTEPGKSAGNQQNETGNNPGNTREQTETDPSDPGKNPSHPGNDAKSTRAQFEPAHGPRGFLNELPHETQQEILDLLDELPYVQVTMTLAQPKPDGLGVRVSKGALERFYKRHQLARLRKDSAERAADLKAFVTDPSTSIEDFMQATSRVVRTRLLEISQQAHSIDSLKDVATVLDRLRRTDISERRGNLKPTPPASKLETS